MRKLAGIPRTPAFLAWLVLGMVLELGVFLGLCSLGASGFAEQVSEGDTPEYLRVATHLADTGTLPPSFRTPGYPIFLAGCFLLGGKTYGYHVAIAVQLVVNLVFAAWFWLALGRYAPSLGSRLRVVATAFLFLAGIGLAATLLTDFLAGVLFALFLDGLISKRDWRSVVVAGACFFLATLARPTFNLFVLLIPAAGYLAGRFSSRLPIWQMGFYALCGLGAVTVSAADAHRHRDDYDNRGFPYYHVRIVLKEVFYVDMDRGTFDDLYRAQIAAQCGKRLGSVTRAEADRAAFAVFIAHIRSQPVKFAALYAKSLAKYVFVPCTQMPVMRVFRYFGLERWYTVAALPALFILWLPVWLLSLAPPLRQPRRYIALYILVMMASLYILGLSAVAPLGGERMRFPVLPFWFLIAAMNAHDLLNVRSRGNVSSANGPLRPAQP